MLNRVSATWLVSEAKYRAPQEFSGQYRYQAGCQHASPAIEQCFTDEVNGNDGQGGQDCREISADHVYEVMAW